MSGWVLLLLLSRRAHSPTYFQNLSFFLSLAWPLSTLVSIILFSLRKFYIHTSLHPPLLLPPFFLIGHHKSQASTRNADYLLTTTNYHNTLDHPPSQHIPISIKASKSVSLSKQANQFLSLASYHDKTGSIIATKNRSLWFHISRVIHRIIERVHFKPCRSIMLSEHSSSNVA